MPTDIVRTPRFAVAACILFLTGAAFCPFSAQAAQAKAPATYTFRFAPTLGRGPIETLRQTKVQEAGGTRRSTAMTLRSRTTTRAIPGGYRSTTEHLSASSTSNGKPVTNKLVTDLVKIPYTLDISKDGQLLRVHGYEKAIARLQSDMPPQMKQVFSSLLSQVDIEGHARAEWDRRIGGFVGQEFRIGDVVQGTAEAPVDGGNPVVWNSRIRYAGIVPKAGRNYVRVTFYYSVDPASATEWTEQFMSQLMQSMPNAPGDFDISNVQIVESGERLIHPQTMTIASEKSTKRISMRMTMNGQTGNMTRTETKQYNLALPAPKPAVKKKAR